MPVESSAERASRRLATRRGESVANCPRRQMARTVPYDTFMFVPSRFFRTRPSLATNFVPLHGNFNEDFKRFVCSFRTVPVTRRCLFSHNENVVRYLIRSRFVDGELGFFKDSPSRYSFKPSTISNRRVCWKSVVEATLEEDVRITKAASPLIIYNNTRPKKCISSIYLICGDSISDDHVNQIRI